MSKSFPKALMVVQIPQAVAADWWWKPFSDIVDAVERGEITDATAQAEAEYKAPKAPNGYAWLRQDVCQGVGRTVLLSQGW